MYELDQIRNKILQGNTLDILKKLPDECIDCVVTSPPYFGLRDYGEETNTIWGGDPNCKHEWELERREKQTQDFTNLHIWDGDGRKRKAGKKTITLKLKNKSGFCKKCGAWYGQLGLEPTLDLYLDHLLEIMKELKRVLKKTGIIFWNHGDCYGGSGCGKGDYRNNNKRSLSNPNLYCEKPNPQLTLTPKCMALQNYRFILRCVDELGLILRDVIIWHKPNHMPSSVKDRFTNAYEPVFMLVKSRKYWFDLDAVRKPYTKPLNRWGGNLLKAKGVSDWDEATGQQTYRNRNMRPNPQGKNPDDVWEHKEIYSLEVKDENGLVFGAGNLSQDEIRAIYGLILGLRNGKEQAENGDLWTIPTQPFPEAHFATFPEKLIEPMIKAGCPQWICKKCGKARVRIIRSGYETDGRKNRPVLGGGKTEMRQKNLKHFTMVKF